MSARPKKADKHCCLRRPNTNRREILQSPLFSPQCGYCYFSIYSVNILFGGL